MSSSPSEFRKEITEINKHSVEDVMIIPQTKNAFMRIFGEKNGEIALLKESTYFKELLSGDNGENLRNCTALSVQSALITILGDGLSLSNILNEATILPYYNKKQEKWLARPCIMYSGKIKMLSKNGIISHIKHCEIVWDCDIITCTNGIYTHTKVFGKPKLTRIGVLLIAVLQGGVERHVFIEAPEMEKRKKASKTPYLWDAWTDQYWKKTAVHELFKYLPKTASTQELIQKFEQEDEEVNYITHEVVNEETVVETVEAQVEAVKTIEQDPILVDTLMMLIKEYGEKLLTPDQITKTKENIANFDNEKLTTLINRLNDQVKKLTDDQPPF